VLNTRVALATAQKSNQSVAEYVGKMLTLENEMVAANRSLEDVELVEYILTDLDNDFNSFISA
jgi:hypothetical protein